MVADKDLLNTSVEFDFPLCTLVVHSSPVSSCFRLFPPCFRLMDTDASEKIAADPDADTFEVPPPVP